MQGIVRDKGTRLEFSYEQRMMSDTYTVEINGEVFSGRSVMVDSGETFATAFGTTFGATSSTSSSATVIASSTSGRFKATLLGNRGWVDNVFVQRLWRSVKYEDMLPRPDAKGRGRLGSHLLSNCTEP